MTVRLSPESIASIARQFADDERLADFVEASAGDELDIDEYDKLSADLQDAVEKLLTELVSS